MKTRIEVIRDLFDEIAGILCRNKTSNLEFRLIICELIGNSDQDILSIIEDLKGYASRKSDSFYVSTTES